MEIRGREYPGRKEAHAYVNQLRMNNGISDEYWKVNVVEKKRLSGTSFFYKIEHNNVVYELEANVDAKLEKTTITHKTNYTLKKKYGKN